MGIGNFFQNNFVNMWPPLPTVCFLFWLLMSSFSTHTWSCIIRFFSHSKLDSSLLVVLCRAIRAYDVGSYQKEETRVGGMIIMLQLPCVLCGIYGLNQPFSSKTTEKINDNLRLTRSLKHGNSPFQCWRYRRVWPELHWVLVSHDDFWLCVSLAAGGFMRH